MNGFTFDAGGLIALDHNDRRVLLVLSGAAERNVLVTVPATALAQVLRNPARQARLMRFIRDLRTDLVALDGPDATSVGFLLARTGTADIVDAHVVICARRAGQSVITSDRCKFRPYQRFTNQMFRSAVFAALTDQERPAYSPGMSLPPKLH